MDGNVARVMSRQRMVGQPDNCHAVTNHFWLASYIIVMVAVADAIIVALGSWRPPVWTLTGQETSTRLSWRWGPSCALQGTLTVTSVPSPPPVYPSRRHVHSIASHLCTNSVQCLCLDHASCFHLFFKFPL